MSQDIQLIELSKLKINPSNPRKHYRDIGELTASIKERGILQNLTVVPDKDDTYLVIIGNRRLTAAKKAGLSHAPCKIEDMDEKTQVSTMLLENLQRDDLTVYEEATGFQMCLELGMSEEDLAKKTGFSKTTIKHRTKLLELDQDKLKEKAINGATIFVFMKLEKIKDPDTRNQVMEKLGTNNFDWALQQAINKEKAQKITTAYVKILKTFASKIDKVDYSIHEYIHGYRSSVKEDIEKPDDYKERKYFYVIPSWGGGVELYRLKNEKEIESSQEQSQIKIEQAEYEKRNNEFSQVAKTMFDMRHDYFISKTRNKLPEDKLFYFSTLIMGLPKLKTKENQSYPYTAYGLDSTLFAKLSGIDLGDQELLIEDVVESATQNPKKCIERTIYCCLEAGESIPCKNYYDEYDPDPVFALLYSFMEEIGYQVSDIEQQILDGSHSLYVQAESEE